MVVFFRPVVVVANSIRYTMMTIAGELPGAVASNMPSKVARPLSISIDDLVLGSGDRQT